MGTRGLQELGGGTEPDLEVSLDLQEVRAMLTPKAQGVRPREEEHSRWHRGEHLELAYLGPGQFRSLTCWVTLMEGGLGTVASCEPSGFLRCQGLLQLASPSAFYDQEIRAAKLAGKRESGGDGGPRG